MTTTTLTVTDAAAQAIRAAADSAAATLRLTVSPSFQYDLRLDTPGDTDVQIPANGVVIILDAESATRADGLTLDYPPTGGGFTIDNPNAPAPIEQISPEDLKALIDNGNVFELIDVRTPGERAIAMIAGSKLLDQTLHDTLLEADRSTPLVFQCHHGIRSQSAAEYFQQAGFRRVYNLAGGIDAWSQRVDPSVTRY